VKPAVKLSDPVALPIAPQSPLQVNVVYTQLPEGAETLQVASAMARGLGAQVTIHLAREIPYPLEMHSPPVDSGFIEQKLVWLARGQSIETTIHVYLCRDLNETIRMALAPESVVVMTGRRHWWRTREQSLARELRGDGHHVIFIYAD
jgi:hypothetical protein